MKRAFRAIDVRAGRSKSCGCKPVFVMVPIDDFPDLPVKYHAKLRTLYSGKPYKDLSGERIGKLVVMNYCGSTQKKYMSYWVCKCDCGNTTLQGQSNLLGGQAQSCGCSKGVAKRSRSWRGVGDLSSSYWKRVLHGAKYRELKVEVTIEEAWGLFLEQEGKCALSGTLIEMFKKHQCSGTASFDRIDSGLGYILGNVQWVHRDVNNMKMHFPESRFIEICKLITEYQLTKIPICQSHTFTL